MTKGLRRFLEDESGATAIEYGLIATLIALAIIGSAGLFGGKLTALFNYITNAVDPVLQNATAATG